MPVPVDGKAAAWAMMMARTKNSMITIQKYEGKPGDKWDAKKHWARNFIFSFKSG